MMRNPLVTLVIWPMMALTLGPIIAVWDLILLVVERTTRLRPPWSITLSGLLTALAWYLIAFPFSSFLEGLSSKFGFSHENQPTHIFEIHVSYSPLTLLLAISQCLLIILSCCIQMLVLFWTFIFQHPVSAICFVLFLIAATRQLNF